MAGDKDDETPSLGKQFDRAAKQAIVLGVTGSAPLTEPEFWFLQKPDLVFARDCHIPALAPLEELFEVRAVVLEAFSSSLRKKSRSHKRLFARVFLKLIPQFSACTVDSANTPSYDIYGCMVSTRKRPHGTSFVGDFRCIRLIQWIGCDSFPTRPFRLRTNRNFGV